MTELTNTLYEFITRNYTAGIYNEPDYEIALNNAAVKEEKLKSQLDDRQCKLLDELLEELRLARRFEREHLFQATLSLSRELSRLVRP